MTLSAQPPCLGCTARVRNEPAAPHVHLVTTLVKTGLAKTSAAACCSSCATPTSSTMMFQNLFVPTLSAFPPQMLGCLLNVIEKLLSKGYNEAAARIALLACPPCLSPPPPSPPPHWCPLSSPPPSPPTRPKQRRRRRRSKSPSPSTTFSAHLSSDIDALLHSISNLPVTPLIKEESESLEEGVEREVLTMPPPSLGCAGRGDHRQAGGQHRREPEGQLCRRCCQVPVQ